MLDVNRSTYYKHLQRHPSRRQQENVEIRKRILELYAQSDKRLGTKKMPLCLAREYCIHISEGRVYRLMKQMRLPQMSTAKPPKAAVSNEDIGICRNLLSQRFDQKAPNLVWVCNFTYVKVGGKFYYIYAILNLYSRKVIACRKAGMEQSGGYGVVIGD